jgi:hypothetical protein
MLLDYEMPIWMRPGPRSAAMWRRSDAFPVIILTGARHAAADQVIGLERGDGLHRQGTDRCAAGAVRGARDRASTQRVVRGRLRRRTARRSLAW